MFKMLRKKNNCDNTVQAATPENLRIWIDNVFKTFMENPEAYNYDFPSDLNNLQRKYAHEKARKLNLQSKSHGKEPNRILRISKRAASLNFEGFYLNFTENSSIAIDNLINKQFCEFSSKYTTFKTTNHHENIYGRLSYGQPVKINPANFNLLMNFRKTLPIWDMQQNILDLIKNNRVVIVESETGSGKTTQIPQFILEEAFKNNEKCRVICTQPRRISAVSVAERVAAERGEKVGSTVGYHIRLESKFSMDSALIFCTNGILLRTLMSGNEYLTSLTHVIVDEIHERDKFSDFLLICLKDCLLKFPHFKVILMSATMHTDLFQKYFPEAAICNIPGRLYSITQLFLEDILQTINYESISMRNIRRDREKNKKFDVQYKFTQQQIKHEQNVDEDYLDEIINCCCSTGSDDSFAQFMQQIIDENVSVDYQHSTTGFTGLMAAAMHGKIDTLEKLLYLRANVHLTCKKGWTALNWAQYYSKQHVSEVLAYLELNRHEEEVFQQQTQNLFSDYDQTVRDDIIDFELIVAIIDFILKKDVWGSILVFLPGYDDIMICQEEIYNSRINKENIIVFMLHGGMQVHAQNDVFKSYGNKRKIILATNVAETSITIDDVVFVIDTGKAKEKTYDAYSGISALETSWISQACVKQRAGRAGRTRNGLCFHMFSKARYESMQPYRTAEILRVPLQELCLHTKLLAPKDVSIANFLGLAIEPPSILSVQSAIRSLQALHALNSEEYLTPLGKHLVQLSIEPHLGKMLIYSAIFKCIDPVLTIVSCLAHKDPFSLPAQASLKGDANAKRKQLTKDTLSDHMSYLAAYQTYLSMGSINQQKDFCKRFYVNQATMEMIAQTRNQLFVQLKAAGFLYMHGPNSIYSLNSNSFSWSLVKAVLSVGLYPNVAYVRNESIFTKTEKNVVMHGSSCLFKYVDDKNKNTLHQWFIFEELSKSGKNCVIKCATVINPVTIALMCGDAILNECENSIMIDNWLDFEPSNKNFYNLRLRLEDVIMKKINTPNVAYNDFDNNVIDTVRYILTTEDAVCKLINPPNVGLSPKNNCKKGLQNENNGRKMNGDFRNFTSYKKVNGNNNHTKPPFRSRFINNSGQQSFKGNDAFFIIKFLKEKEINISVTQGVWPFAQNMQCKLLQSLHQGKQIILFFSIQGSKVIHGVAQALRPAIQQPYWSIKWIRTGHLYYRCYQDLFAESNMENLVDGEELEPSIGSALYFRFIELVVPDKQRRPILGHHNTN